MFVGVTQVPHHPPNEAERDFLTEWHAGHPVDTYEAAWVGAVDGNGGQWIAVRDPEWPLFVFGFYFELDGTNTGFRMEPLRLSESGPSVKAPQVTVRMLRKVNIAKLEQAARVVARSVAQVERFDAVAEYRIVDADGLVIDRQPLNDGGGVGSARHLAAERRIEGLATDAEAIKPRGGHPRVLTDRFYAEQAERYVKALAGGKPIETVAKATSYAPSQVRNHIARARELGYLSRTLPGRSGGELLPAAYEVLGQTNDDKGTK